MRPALIDDEIVFAKPVKPETRIPSIRLQSEASIGRVRVSSICVCANACIFRISADAFTCACAHVRAWRQ
eukprot:2860241-Pleurochrysis_carterae.AAC.1